MTKRILIDLEQFKSQINILIATSKGDPAYRAGLAVALELILTKKKAYKGYRYLPSRDIPKGERPGLIETFDSLGNSIAMVHNAHCDSSRREYY